MDPAVGEALEGEHRRLSQDLAQPLDLVLLPGPLPPYIRQNPLQQEGEDTGRLLRSRLLDSVFHFLSFPSSKKAGPVKLDKAGSRRYNKDRKGAATSGQPFARSA